MISWTSSEVFSVNFEKFCKAVFFSQNTEYLRATSDRWTLIDAATQNGQKKVVLDSIKGVAFLEIFEKSPVILQINLQKTNVNFHYHTKLNFTIQFC